MSATDMSDDKDALPSDAEKGALKPKDPKASEPSPPPPEDNDADKNVEKDPSEQPS